LGFGEQSSAVAQHRVGFTPAVNGGILSLNQDGAHSTTMTTKPRQQPFKKPNPEEQLTFGLNWNTKTIV